jgi:MoaA/NifB/PqqE/SkfB family radical SAM enzyme
MCSRNNHGGQDNPWLEINNWSIVDYKTIISTEVINQVESIFFCGNFGDPCMNKDLLEMCEYTRLINPNVNIRIHTNGGIQNEEWWTKLAEVLGENSTVIFAIDGLDDTNHLYRIGVNYNKLMKNVKSFITAGGNASWAFIEFKHNQHQKNECESLSKTLGFRTFSHKQSSRFLLDTAKFPVLDKDGNTIYNLEPSTENKIIFIDKKIVNDYKKIVANSLIKCRAKENAEVYIDAFGHLFPCCFMGLTPYNYFDPDSEISHIKQEMLDEHKNYIRDMGGTNAVDCKRQSIKNIIDSVPYQNIWDKYWVKEKIIVCAKTCGVNKFSNPADQFISDN